VGKGGVCVVACGAWWGDQWVSVSYFLPFDCWAVADMWQLCCKQGGFAGDDEEPCYEAC